MTKLASICGTFGKAFVGPLILNGQCEVNRLQAVRVPAGFTLCGGSFKKKIGRRNLLLNRFYFLQLFF